MTAMTLLPVEACLLIFLIWKDKGVRVHILIICPIHTLSQVNLKNLDASPTSRCHSSGSILTHHIVSELFGFILGFFEQV